MNRPAPRPGNAPKTVLGVSLSIEAVAWAFKQGITPAAKKFVLVALADNADQHGICFPSYTHIQEKTSLSRRAVIDNIQALAEEGIIEKVGRARANSSTTTNAYRIPIPSKGLADHPLISLFAEGGAADAPGGVQEVHPGGAGDAPQITINRIKKEKKGALSRAEFLREIDGGLRDGQFNAFEHLTESEVKIAAEACWDFWAGKGEWPGGDTIAIMRNWIRGGMAQGRIRKRTQATPAQAAGSAVSSDDSKWRMRLRGFVDQGFWRVEFGPAPDEMGCKVPPHLMTEFFPDGKIPSTQTA